MNNPAWLIGPQPNGQTGQWRLDKDDFLIGREAPADLVIPIPRISRRHALITHSGSDYFLADLGSRNGTFVNGQPVGSEPWHLQDRDELVLGGSIAFRFHDPNVTVEGPRLGRLKGVWLDEAAHEVWVDAQRVEPPLSVAQFTLLTLLYQSVGQLIPRAQIIATVWAGLDPAGVSEEAVDGLIKRLRARLRETQVQAEPGRPLQGEYLEVLRGHGLRLIQPDD